MYLKKKIETLKKKKERKSQIKTIATCCLVIMMIIAQDVKKQAREITQQIPGSSQKFYTKKHFDRERNCFIRRFVAFEGLLSRWPSGEVVMML